MTPILIIDRAVEKVKSEVFGRIVADVESTKDIDLLWLQIEQVVIHTLSGNVHTVNVHDWEVDSFEEYEDKWFGKIELKVSHSFDACEEDALYAAHCSISELNALIRQVVINGEALKVNDFSIDWESVYTE